MWFKKKKKSHGQLFFATQAAGLSCVLPTVICFYAAWTSPDSSLDQES